jgi:hypothetical protein
MLDQQPTWTGDDVTEETIALRAYELSQGDEAGTPEENWLRAESELRAASTETPVDL